MGGASCGEVVEVAMEAHGEDEVGGEDCETPLLVLGGAAVAAVAASWPRPSAAGLVLFASAFRDTPRRAWISSELRPLDSRNEILCSVDASRIESSCRKRAAWSTRSCRAVSAVVDGVTSSELGAGDCSAGGSAGRCCQEGMIGDFLDDESGMLVGLIDRQLSKTKGKNEEEVKLGKVSETM